MVCVREEPFHASYQLETAADFSTRRLLLEVEGERWSRRLEIVRDAAGRWSSPTGAAVPPLEGALDVDLTTYCITNSPPVLRHRLHEVPGSVELLVAWVTLPDAEVKAVRQRYTHVAQGRVLYESGSFRSELEFDEHGLVVDYPAYAKRVYP
jgi:hypothetical protein